MRMVVFYIFTTIFTIIMRTGHCPTWTYYTWDMIIQNISEDGQTDMTFSCPTNQVVRAENALNAAKSGGQVDFKYLLADTNVAKISAVGIGMRSQSGVAAKMFKTLFEEGINIKVIATSEIKISVLIDRKYMELAVQALHDTFELENVS